MKIETLFTILVIIVTIALTINTVQLTHLENKLLNTNTELYAQNVSSTIGGVYIPSCGFFVDTRGESIGDVEKITTHEAAHAYINQNNRTHFCGEE